MKKLLALTLILPLAACAGRIPDPIEVEQAQDFDQPCLALDAELEGNEAKANFLRGRQATADARNLGVGVLGFTLFAPVYLALDVSDANEREIEALEARRERLHALRASKGCHLKKVVPADYEVYVRERQVYSDEYGRSVEVPVNSYNTASGSTPRVAVRQY